MLSTPVRYRLEILRVTDDAGRCDVLRKLTALSVSEELPIFTTASGDDVICLPDGAFEIGGAVWRVIK